MVKNACQESIWNILYSRNLIWKKEAVCLPPLLKGKRVLEIGVGNGKTLISILRQKPKSVFAIDISEEAVNLCKKQFKNKNLIIKKADILNIPLEQNSFDIVVCYYVLNNLLKKDRKKAVSQIFKALKTRGFILFEDFAINDFRYNKAPRKIEDNTLIKKSGLIQHFFEEKEIRHLFSKFKIIGIEVKFFNPIKSDKKIKRNIISAIIQK